MRRITGGLKDFVDSGNHAPLTVQDVERIETGYEKARKRQKEEKLAKLNEDLKKAIGNIKTQRSQNTLKKKEFLDSFFQVFKK